MLVDIVSKNGNLLLNVPMRADGTLDTEAKTLLESIGKWMDVNGEAIYATRPWIVAGENTVRRADQEHGHGVLNAARMGDGNFKLAASEVRFTSKGDDTLYAVIASWPPDGKVALRTLAKHAASKASVACVELLGHKGELEASLTAGGLAVQLPGRKPCEHAWALKITGKNLRDFKVPEPPTVPHGNHPVRLGKCSDGRNLFRGQIGRATMFRGTLEPDVIKKLAAGNRSEKLTGENVVNCLLNPKVGDTLPTKPDDFADAVSFEAWIQPAKGEAGRIFNNLTAGHRDGFLIDCFPGQSLRVIVGPRQDDFLDVLQADVWQHIAVVMGTKGQLDVYLKGKKLQRR
jgi:hypothetical protein